MPANSPPLDPDAAGSTGTDATGTDAFARARGTRVVVIGGGVAGLVAALEWAKIGARVTVLEASDRLGGMIETADLDGLRVDLVADALPLGAPALGALLDDLGLRAAVEPAAPLPVWIGGLPGARGATRAAPLPVSTVLGIPANPWADDVRRIIGWRGAWRAYLDRVRPPLTIGHERSLGRLVRTRMGDRVAERLVAPVTRGLYGIAPDDIDVEVAAPGLSTALTRTGSLSGAAFELLPASPAAPTRATLRGGLGKLATALVERLVERGAELRVGTRAESLDRTPAGTWMVRVAPAGAPEDTERAPGDESESEREFEAEIVVVATGRSVATRLLRSAGATISAALADDTDAACDVIALVVSTAGHDSAPRGRIVYPAKPPRELTDADALSVAQVSADWPWLADAAGPARLVLRVTLPANRARSDAETVEAARAAASALLGVPLGESRAAARRTVVFAPPASALGHALRTADLRRALDELPGVLVVGAGVAGSGLAQVVADAAREADRVRSAVLWHSGEATGPA